MCHSQRKFDEIFNHLHVFNKTKAIKIICRLYHIDDQPTGATATEEVDFSKAFNVSYINQNYKTTPALYTTSIVNYIRCVPANI